MRINPRAIHCAGQLEATKKGQRSRGKHVKAAPPGTSFNPDPEQHQAALATAVAHEVGKGLERELGVKAPGQIAPAIALAASSPTDGMDELAMLQVPLLSYPFSSHLQLQCVFGDPPSGPEMLM